jgi:tRNA threonylcarbamoyladenosine biosynthesis protein TsaE
LTKLPPLLYHASGAAGTGARGRTSLAIVESHSASETLEIGRRIGRAAGRGTVIGLQGPLGSGKTTLVKGIAEGLGVREPVTSPTFTIVSEYPCTVGGEAGVLHHIDLYRIEGAQELEDLGLEEILAGSGVTVLEWSEKAGELLPEHAAAVHFTIEDGGRRTLDISGVEP